MLTVMIFEPLLCAYDVFPLNFMSHFKSLILWEISMISIRKKKKIRVLCGGLKRKFMKNVYFARLYVD